MKDQPKKNRAERRREAAEARKTSRDKWDQSPEPQGLQLIKRFDHDTYTVHLVETILDKHIELAEAQRNLQRLGTLLYIDKFKFEPNIPMGTRMFWLHRNIQDLREDDSIERRNVVMLAGGTDIPQAAMDLVRAFAEEA